MFYSTGGGGAIGLVYRRQDSRKATEKFAVTVRRRGRCQKPLYLSGKAKIPFFVTTGCDAENTGPQSG